MSRVYFFVTGTFKSPFTALSFCSKTFSALPRVLCLYNISSVVDSSPVYVSPYRFFFRALAVWDRVSYLPEVCDRVYNLVWVRGSNCLGYRVQFLVLREL